MELGYFAMPSHPPEAWEHSLSLLRIEVMPRLKHLDARLGKAA